MQISLSEHGSAVTVTVGRKTEKHSLADLPGSDSLAVADEMLALSHEFPIPSIVYLLKSAEQLLFLAYSARVGSADEENIYDLLSPFSRYRGENTHIFREIGAAAQRLAGHLRSSFACLLECGAGREEAESFHALQACRQAAADLRLFSHEAQERFVSMAELSTNLLEQLTGENWPWGLKGNLGYRPASEKPWGFEALDTFLTEQDGIWRLRNTVKRQFREAKSQYLPGLHLSKEMERAERERNGLAVIPLMFRAFCVQVSPVATSLQDEGHDAGNVRKALEHLVFFSECRMRLLQHANEHVTLLKEAVLAGKLRESAIQALAAAIPIFQEIGNIMGDFHELCDDLDDGHYLSFHSHFRLEALFAEAREQSREKRREFYTSPPVAQAAFMSMTRIQAVARLCATYCAGHERELPQQDSLTAFSVMSVEEHHPSRLAATLAESFKTETTADAIMSHLRLLERRERILGALS